MYRAVLRLQWVLYAPIILIGTILALLLPIAQVMFTGASGLGGGAESALQMLGLQEGINVGYPVLAIAGGLLMAALCWQDDQIGKHIYALTLPVPRWYYLLLRLGAGLSMIALPVVALWVSALFAAAQVTLPAGLHAYPTGLAVRFALCSATAFCIMFALCSTSRQTRIIVGAVVGAMMLVMIFLAALGYADAVDAAVSRLFTWPSVTDAFFARWRLIDV